MTKQIAKRYRRATKAEKGSMLDELCASQPQDLGDEVLEPLRFIWATLNAPAGKKSSAVHGGSR